MRVCWMKLSTLRYKSHHNCKKSLALCKLPCLLLSTLVSFSALAATLRVPSQVADLQTALVQANDGDVIEMAAGTYFAPPSGFRLENNAKTLTIMSAPSATVRLEGGGQGGNIFWFGYSDNYAGTHAQVSFEGLTFSNGYSEENGVAAGITMLSGAIATFKSCIFENNVNEAASTGGGGMLVGDGSTIFIFDSQFIGNLAKNEGGGISIKTNSTVHIHNSKFVNNRTNIPGHRTTSAGGAIHMGDSKLRVTNSRFEGNRSGYVAGAIYSIGTYQESWTGPPDQAPGAEVIISNSTFLNNGVMRDSNNLFYQPTEGGAVHSEDMAKAYIYSSRFEKNFAMDGGAVNLYRADVEVHDSVFLGNQAIGAAVEGHKSLGGTFSVVSNEASDATTGFGFYNRSSGTLSISNSYIQGGYDSVIFTADVGGCLYASGDSNRVYGENGITQEGTVTSNRAQVTVQGTAFNNCDVQSNILAGSGVGGGIAVDLVDLTIQDSFIINSDAVGNNSSGGAIAIFNQSTSDLSRIAVQANSAEGFGGALFVQGSHIALSDCSLVENEISPLVAESSNTSYGAALFTAPFDGDGGNRYGVIASGSVENCIISNNVGLPIWDDDRTDGPINSVVYNGNQIYNNSFSDSIYTTGGLPNNDLTVAELNSLVVNRNIGISTIKSDIDNTALADASVIAQLMAVPNLLYSTNALGDPSPPTTSYLVYSWDGTTAEINGSALIPKAGAITTTIAGENHLEALGFPSAHAYATIINATSPSVSLSANPDTIAGGFSTTLSWVLADTLLEAAIDHGVSIDPINGSVSVSPSTSTSFNMHLISKQGGAHSTRQVNIVDGLLPKLTVSLGDTLLLPGEMTTILYTASDSSNVFFEGSYQSQTDDTIAAMPGGTTEYAVQAVNGFGTTLQKVTIHVNNGQWPIGVPNITQPMENEVLLSNTGTLTLSWNPVATATGYYLELWDASTGQTVHCEEVGAFDNDSSIGKPHCPAVVKNNTFGNTTQVTLSRGKYTLAVRACDKTVSNFERCGLFSTRPFELGGVLPAPTLLQPAPAQVLPVRGVTFTWSSVSGAAGYGLEVINRVNGSPVFSGSLIGQDSTFTLVSLPNGEFKFEVRACGANSFEAANCSTSSTVDFDVELTTPNGVPSILTPLDGATLTTSTQTFSWNAVSKSDENEDLYYEVLMEDLTGGTTALQITVLDPETFTIASLPASTNYKMRVRACQAGCGYWSIPVNFSMVLAATPTTAPTISNLNMFGFSLTAGWTEVTGADLYQFQVIQPAGGPGNSALTVAAKQVSATTATVSVPTGQASLVVRACTGNGCGPLSSPVTINPSGTSPSSPHMGAPLAGSYVDGPIVNFSWSRIPGDDGSNTIYRLYVQDLSRQSAALDIYTNENYYAAFFKAEGSRYDSLVIANPGPSQVAGPATGFTVSGLSATSPTMVQPAHESIIQEGNIQLGWTPMLGATLYEYFVAVQGESSATVRGVTPGLLVQVALSAIGGSTTRYSGIVRACPESMQCIAGSDLGWGEWSVNAGPGVTNFTVVP